MLLMIKCSPLLVAAGAFLAWILMICVGEWRLVLVEKRREARRLERRITVWGNPDLAYRAARFIP